MATRAMTTPICICILFALLCLPACTGHRPLPAPIVENTVIASAASTQAQEQHLNTPASVENATAQPTIPPQASEMIAQTEEPLATDEVQYSQISTDELLTQIMRALLDAATASQQALALTTAALEDETLSDQELQPLYEATAVAQEQIYVAEEMLESYYYLYADSANAAIQALYALEEDLDALLPFTSQLLAVEQSSAAWNPETIAAASLNAEGASAGLDRLMVKLAALEN